MQDITHYMRAGTLQLDSGTFAAAGPAIISQPGKPRRTAYFKRDFMRYVPT